MHKSWLSRGYIEERMFISFPPSLLEMLLCTLAHLCVIFYLCVSQFGTAVQLLGQQDKRHFYSRFLSQSSRTKA